MIMNSKSLALVLALVTGWTSRSAGEDRVSHPFEGVTHIARSVTSPRNLNIHVVVIELSAPGISFKLTPPGGSRDTVRQTTLEFLNLQQAQVAINVHFFVPYPSAETEVDVVGLAVSLGNLYSPFEPQPVAEGYVDQSYAILPFAPALNIDRSNRVTVVYRDPAFPDNRRVLEPVTLWNAFSGSALIVSNGMKSMPDYSGASGGLNPTATYGPTNSWYALRHARAAIGVTADQRRLVLFTVDQAGGSVGMAVGEVAELLINEFQVAAALNVDGGGSTTLAMQDPVTLTGRVVNVPSDRPSGRAVGSSLAVFARPRPPAVE